MPPATTPCIHPKGSPKSKDTAPQELVEGLDLEKIAKEHGVLKASLNGPKLWLPDWVEVAVGKEREFNGMMAGWIAELNMGENVSVGEGAPYKPMSYQTHEQMGLEQGYKDDAP